MRLKLLLAMLLVSGGFLLAQDTIKTLIITEAKLDRADEAYIEITNVGDEALNLKDFEITSIDPWTGFPDTAQFPINAPQPSDDRSIERLPDYVLAPGESYVIAALSDQTERTYAKDVAKYGYSQDWGPYLTNPKLVPLIDLPEYRNEGPSRINEYGDRDSVSTGSADRTKNFSNLLEDWDGRNCMFIRHHISPTDSAVIDQINGVWGDSDNSNPDAGNLTVAGVEKTGGNYVLIRNFKVKQGNVVFQPGTDIENSEWIPVPFLGSRIEVGVRDTYGEHSRGPFWTVGNHLDAHLTDLTPASADLELDMVNMTIKVPWGVRNNDSIMSLFNYTPGIAWHYDFAHTYEDSAFSSIRTGDSLTLYAVGNTLEMAKLKLEVKDPLVTENRVIPKYRPMQDEKNTRFFGSYIYVEIPYVVTDGLVTDTISDIPFATRTDTLLKYLEKPENASWEFVWVDGVERTDVKDGDVLQVTAEDGSSVKDYYLKVLKYPKNRSFYLSSITWPDISEIYQITLGWENGDTIPGFESGVANYVIEMPSDLTGVPALVGKTEDQNAKMEVKRAINLTGSTEDRSFTFTVTAENDTVWKTYSVELVKRKAPENVQPWLGEPFISQWVFRDQWNNTFLEVVNPGTDVLDLSHYMLIFTYEQTSADAIESVSEATFYDPTTQEDGDFDWRYQKYIPGRVWVDTAEWAANPARCEQDLSVNTMIQPGDVFVIGDVNSAGTAAGSVGYKSFDGWPMRQVSRGGVTDIFLTNTYYIEGSDTIYFSNWPERASKAKHSLDSWWGEHIYLLKILNDSVRDGTKAATNPNDFEVLDVWGAEGNNDQPTIGGVLMNQLYAYTRKPEIYKGNPVLEGSWGDTIITADTTLYPEQTTEWIMVNDAYYSALGEGWAFNILKICDGFGSHFMNEVTVYKSTVNSNAYKVSEGYSMDEEIRGTVTGTTVDQFLANINKVDTGQTLIVKSAGVEIEGGTVLTDGDSLVVISADSANTSMYYIEVTDEGLNNDVELTSETYTISYEPAEVGGFELGTLLKDVVEGVNVPFGATMNVINSKDQLVPLKTIRFDTTYVDVLATSDIYFEVTAENGDTTLVYQLMPEGDETDAYVTSSVFDVDQNLRQIKLIPDGTTVDALYANLTPSNGASMMLLDKLGYERTEGMVVGDDQLVVTAADGVTTNAYVLLMLHGTATYLAYVLSDVYTVDQNLLTISGSGITVDLSVTDFLANLLPSTGSTMEVQDNTGAGKAGADMLADEDQLHVLAANGVAYTDYSIVLSTGVADQGIDNLSIYPNPTSGQFYIDGLEPGLRIRVYNAVGVALRNITAHSSNEQISLDDQPNGMYYITVSNGDDVIGRYKVIKQ